MTGPLKTHWEILGVSIPLKYISLSVLTIQTSMTVAVVRYSRTVNEDHYSISTAIVTAEVIKFFVSLFLVYYESESFGHFKHNLSSQLFGQGWESVQIVIPSVLYLLQNNLLFIALSYLDAATYQVTYQLKILTTAFFSVLLLNRKLDAMKWFSLVLLFLGVSFVQLSVHYASVQQLTPEQQAEEAGSTGNHLLGLIAIIAACILSGLAGVYLERVLKHSRTSLWVRNVQMSIYSFIIGALGLLWNESDFIFTNGFFYGYTPLVWCVVLLQACSGVVVALVVKYADNILKGFGTSISIVLSSVVSAIWFSFQPTYQWLLGTLLVMISTFIYSLPTKAPLLLPGRDLGTATTKNSTN